MNYFLQWRILLALTLLPFIYEKDIKIELDNQTSGEKAFTGHKKSFTDFLQIIGEKAKKSSQHKVTNPTASNGIYSVSH